MKRVLSIIPGVSLLLFLCGSAVAAEVMVFAAASLTDSLRQTAAIYQKQSEDRIAFNFAGSGPLARQIEEGAPADIFFSADETAVDVLGKRGLLVPGTRVNRLSNTLAMVTTPEETGVRTPSDLTNAMVRRIALGEVRTVPAGAYARTYLQAQGIWPSIEKKIVPCDNVRAVLAAVASGNVDAGFVYRTDVALSKEVKVAFLVPAKEGPQITYPMALVKGGRHPEAARKFLEFLSSPAAGDIFRRAGFILLEAPQRGEEPRPRELPPGMQTARTE
jgi:molybdate transport system substrate-binding protein